MQNLNALAVNEDNSAYVEFTNFLNSEIDAWVSETYKNIIADLNGIEKEKGLTVVRNVKVGERLSYNSLLGKKLMLENLEAYNQTFNMYWNGKLKLRFNPNVSYYSKNSGVFKSYYMSVSLTNELKTFISKLETMLEKIGVTLVVDATLYDGNGLKTTVYFDNLSERYNYHADCEYVLRFISLNLSYVITFN